MKSIRWWFFGVLALAISLLLTLPAVQAVKWLSLPENISLQGVSGRALSGKATHVTINGIAVRDVAWQWRPQDALTGKLGVDWQIADTALSGQGIAHGTASTQHIADANVQISLVDFAALIPTGIQLAGAATVSINSLTISKEQLTQAKLVIDISNLAITSPLGNLALPKVLADFSGTAETGWQLNLIDDAETPSINLIATQSAGFIKLNGTIAADAPLAQQLGGILTLIAKQNGNVWQVSWQFEAEVI